MPRSMATARRASRSCLRAIIFDEVGSGMSFFHGDALVPAGHWFVESTDRTKNKKS